MRIHPNRFASLLFTASVAAGLAGGLAATLASPAAAADEKARDPRVAHREADKNGDGYVDREEFHLRMVEIFFHGDRDKDGYMTHAELERTVIFPDDFALSDFDEDGRVSLYEFIHTRFQDFDPADTDSDGRLSVPEVVAVFERGGFD